MSQPTLSNPGAVVIDANILIAICSKEPHHQTAAEHQAAMAAFNVYMQTIHPSPQGDIPFILRAEEIRSGYSCLHSADGFYIALTEELAKSGPAELLTFDQRAVNVAAKNAPTVKVNLLPT